MAINNLIVSSGQSNPGPFAGMMQGRESRQNLLNAEANRNALIARQPLENHLLGQRIEAGNRDAQTYDATVAAQSAYPVFSQAAQSANPQQARALIGQLQGVPGLLDDGEDLGQLMSLPDDVFMQAVTALRDKTGALSGMTANTAGLREFGAMTQGMSPEDVQRARRIHLGLDPRATGASAKTVMVRGADGRERVGIFDPVSRSLQVSTERGWMAAGPGDVMTGLADGIDMTTLVGRPPEQQAALTTTATKQAEGAVAKAGNRTKVESSIAARRDQSRMIDELIDKAKANAGAFTTGFFGSLSSGIPGTPAHDMQATLTTIQSNLGLDKLQQLRDESPTGGALGQVTEREHALLQAVWGSLQQSQSQEQFLENLERVRSAVRSAWQRVAEAYEKDYGVPLPADIFRQNQAAQPSQQGAPAAGGWSIRRLD